MWEVRLYPNKLPEASQIQLFNNLDNTRSPRHRGLICIESCDFPNTFFFLVTIGFNSFNLFSFFINKKEMKASSISGKTVSLGVFFSSVWMQNPEALLWRQNSAKHSICVLKPECVGSPRVASGIIFLNTERVINALLNWVLCFLLNDNAVSWKSGFSVKYYLCSCMAVVLVYWSSVWTDCIRNCFHTLFFFFKTPTEPDEHK